LEEISSEVFIQLSLSLFFYVAAICLIFVYSMTVVVA